LGYSHAKVGATEIQQVLEGNKDYQDFKHLVADNLSAWLSSYRDLLTEIKEGTAPKPIIHELSESLLQQFSHVPLLDRYDVYEQLMRYWGDTMQDDVYLISAEGWVEAAKPRPPIKDKEPKISEEPDLVIGTARSTKKYKMDLVPPALVVARCFAAEQEKLDRLQLVLEQATQELEEYVEEHSGEDGLLEDVVNDKCKIIQTLLRAQIATLSDDAERADEFAVTPRCAGS
jgi:type I restriction enzyme M protein